MLYDHLLGIAKSKVIEMDMPLSIKGLYGDYCIWINIHIVTRTEKACTLAEEIGHEELTEGDILDQDSIPKRKQELLARQWGYEYLVPLSKIVEAYRAKVEGRYAIAEYLGVTEEFLQAAVDRYTEKYGLHVSLGSSMIYFNPLRVIDFSE